MSDPEYNQDRYDFERTRRERSLAQANDRPGTIYFLTYGDDGPIKIGFTSNLDYRVQHIQTGCPFEVRVLGTVLGGMGLERQIHQRLWRYRLKGEWFTNCHNVLSVMRELVAAAEKQALAAAPKPDHPNVAIQVDSSLRGADRAFAMLGAFIERMEAEHMAKRTA